MGGGGGGGAKTPQSQTVTTVNIPPELMPDVQANIGRARALTDINQNPWQQYAGPRFADINPLQQQYMRGTSNLGPSEELGYGTNLTGMAGLGALNSGRFGQQEAQDYMSPYIQNVLDVQKNDAVRDYARGLPQLGANAARAGGIGGSRSAIAQSEAQRNLQNSMQNIDATGMQNAFSNAQQQYNSDQARRMQGLGLALQGGQQMGQLGQQRFDQQLGSLNAQRVAGADLAQNRQQQLDASYQDFIDQQNYPYKQLGFMSDLLRGAPLAGGTSTVYGRGPNTTGQLANTALGLGSLYFGSKAGGGGG
jgi:hypothetical protein